MTKSLSARIGLLVGRGGEQHVTTVASGEAPGVVGEIRLLVDGLAGAEVEDGDAPVAEGRIEGALGSRRTTAVGVLAVRLDRSRVVIGRAGHGHRSVLGDHQAAGDLGVSAALDHVDDRRAAVTVGLVQGAGVYLLTTKA